MAEIYSYRDRGRRRDAIIRMDNGDPVFITVRKSGVSIKRSRLVLLRAKLYESETFEEAVGIALTFRPQWSTQPIPPGMKHPVLRAFTRAVLRCSTVDEVSAVLTPARGRADFDEVVSAAT